MLPAGLEQTPEAEEANPVGNAGPAQGKESKQNTQGSANLLSGEGYAAAAFSLLGLADLAPRCSATKGTWLSQGLSTCRAMSTALRAQ